MKAPAFGAGALVAGSPELDCVDDDESTPKTSCRRVYLRASCTPKAHGTHTRARELGRVARLARCGTRIAAPILALSPSGNAPIRPSVERKIKKCKGEILSYLTVEMKPITKTASTALPSTGLRSYLGLALSYI